MFKSTAAKLFFLIFIISILLVLSSYYLEYFMNINPCLLCWFQRWTMIFICIAAFFGWLIARNKLLTLLLNTVLFILNLFGLFFSARQIWLQHQTNPQAFSCLPDSSILLKTLPIERIVKLAYTGTSGCGVVHMRPLGLSLSEWSLVAFIVLTILTVFLYRKLLKR